VLGELLQTTDGRWITRPPLRCPNGHLLGPNHVLVGHVACLGHGDGHHVVVSGMRRDGVLTAAQHALQRPEWAYGSADLESRVTMSEHHSYGHEYL
jgi:hypothetical protein